MQPQPHDQARASSVRSRELLAIAGLFAFGLILRIVRLDVLPNGLFCDEASAGYDAYALLQTGKDQFGASWPLFARSFGDYDEASYRYLAESIRMHPDQNTLAAMMEHSGLADVQYWNLAGGIVAVHRGIRYT